MYAYIKEKDMDKRTRVGGIVGALVMMLGVGAVAVTKDRVVEPRQAQIVTLSAVLRQGSKGSEVRQVQEKLKRWG